MAEQTLLQKNIMALLGLTGLPSDRQIALVNKMTELVEKRLMLRIIEEMKEEDKAEAERIFTSGSEEEKLKFLQTKTDFQRLLEEEVVKVKQELKEEVEKLEI